MRNYYTFLLLVSALLFQIQLFGQNKQHEIGIRFSNSNNYGIDFKFGQKHAMWRISTMYIGYDDYSAIEEEFYDLLNYGASFSFGKEFRKEVTSKLEFRAGLELFAQHNLQEFDTPIQINDNRYIYKISNTTTAGGLKFVIGSNIQLKKHFLLGIEVLPSLGYIHQESNSEYPVASGNSDEKIIKKGIQFHAKNTNAKVTLAYRW